MKILHVYLISTMIAFHIDWDGHEAYLPDIKELTKISSRVMDELIIREFPNVS